MFSVNKKQLPFFVFFFLTGITVFGQGEQWIGKLTLSSYNCDSKQACYSIEIKGVSETPWALGDQNYRLFFDAENVSVTSIHSLLSASQYSNAQIDEVLEISGQGQESYSPLDLIDDNLGFIDFSVIAYNKQEPEEAAQIRTDFFLPVADICFEVSDALWETGEEAAMNLYFSEPSTTGQITNQQTIVTQIDDSNHTKSTDAIGFLNITYDSGLEGQLGALCTTTGVEDMLFTEDKVALYPNPLTGNSYLNYQIRGWDDRNCQITLYDINYRPVTVYKDNGLQGTGRIELSNLSAGVYIFRAHDGEEFIQKEFVVNN